MKKYLIIGLVVLLSASTLVGAVSLEAERQTMPEIIQEDFTHTVFAEYGTTTTCPYCPAASSDMYAIYDSGQYPVYYVTLVSNMNDIARQRAINLRLYAVPSVYFDGGYLREEGDVGQPAYESDIQECGAREVKRNIEMETAVTWEGNAKMTIEVTLTNTDSMPYLGFFKSHVTEIESRWRDADNQPYHFALLDYASRRPVLVMPGKEKTISTTFDGTKDHGGQTFEDITEDNIMVISTIAHWIPHIGTGYEELPFLAFYVDQTSAATPI